MDIEAWLAGYGDPVAVDELSLDAPAALVRFVKRHAVQLAEFVAAYKDGAFELVVLDFHTGRPQDSAYDLRRTERIGILFKGSDGMPLVLMLRDDFPDTAHQQLVPEGSPRAICIDDRSWAEARLTWTPAELLQRVLSWFSRAARGELHDARQPIDPIFIGSPLSIVLASGILEADEDMDLVGILDKDDRTILRVLPLGTVSAPIEQLEPVCLIKYRILAEKMQRLSFGPTTLGGLSEILSARGFDLVADLKARLSDWIEEGEDATWRLGSRLAVIVETPIMGPKGELQKATDLRAYLTGRASGEIAEALGIAFQDSRKADRSKVGFVRIVGGEHADAAALYSIKVQWAEVHKEFDRALATSLSGSKEPDERKAVMVGAGAIGSHLADCLVREGRFQWTIIDDDRLLPHNIGRHIAHQPAVIHNKAGLVADMVSACLLDPERVARAIPANVMTTGEDREAVDTALEEADLVIDATASVLAGRYLSDHRSQARRVSVFFNPAGSGGVLLAEPADRSLTLRDLEAQYLGLVATHDDLGDHLTAPEEDFSYTGACRAITNLTPASSVKALAGLIAGGLGRTIDHDSAVIKVWSLEQNGAVALYQQPPERVTGFTAHGWTVTLHAGLEGHILDMRGAHLPTETGGVLLGVVDIPNQSIHLVHAMPAPPDSEASGSGFVRGSEGVNAALDEIANRTGGQVRYVGEWHSHPSGATSRPSPTDLDQIDWLAALLEMETLPGLMLIAADNDVSVFFGSRQATATGRAAAPPAHVAGTG